MSRISLNIHIGLPKAGSTTLQRHLFKRLAPDYVLSSNHRLVIFVGKYHDSFDLSYFDYSNRLRKLLLQSDFSFEKRDADLITSCAGLLWRMLRQSPKYLSDVYKSNSLELFGLLNNLLNDIGIEVVFVVSHEMIYNPMDPTSTFHFFSVCKSLAQLNFEFQLKLLCILRDPEAWLRSSFSQMMINYGYNMDFQHYLEDCFSKGTLHCLDYQNYLIPTLRHVSALITCTSMLVPLDAIAESREYLDMCANFLLDGGAQEASDVDSFNSSRTEVAATNVSSLKALIFRKLSLNHSISMDSMKCLKQFSVDGSKSFYASRYSSESDYLASLVAFKASIYVKNLVSMLEQDLVESKFKFLDQSRLEGMLKLEEEWSSLMSLDSKNAIREAVPRFDLFEVNGNRPILIKSKL